LVQDGNHGEYRPRPEEFAANGVSFIRAADMGNGRVLFDQAARINPSARARIRVGIGQSGDVLLSHKGTVGKVAFVPDGCPEFVCSPQTTFWRVLDFSMLDRSYLFGYLQSAEFKAQLDSRKSETDMAPYVSLTAQRQLTIPIPPLAIQRAIGTVLSALNDRVALLRETNSTLEAVAQALFKSWFVDFDPVRAKQEGRAPDGMDEATAALFPDSFEESELGLVPSGWRVGILQDLLVLQRGFDLPAQNRIPGDFPIIAASGPSGTHSIPMVKGPGVVTGRSGVLGKVFLTLEDYWPLNTSLWIKEFKVALPCYAYELLRLLDFSSFNAGSAVPTLNRNHVHSLKYLLPSTGCVRAFEEMAMLLHGRAKENQNLEKSLTALRDTLLPRLLSGQLRLPEAAEMVDQLKTGT
jgi:type I restriction enzyme S subunit